MPKLTIFNPDPYCRPDKSDEHFFLNEEPVDLGMELSQKGCKIRLQLQEKRAIWYGELELTWEQAEQLRDEIDSGLKAFVVPMVKEH